MTVNALAQVINENRSGIRAYLTSGILCTYTSGVLLVLQLWVLADILTKALLYTPTIHNLLPSLVIFLALVIGRFLSAFAGQYFITQAATYSKRTLRKQIYQTMKTSGPAIIARNGSGAIISSLTEGVEAIGGYYQEVIPTRILMVASPVTLLTVIISIDTVSAFILFITAPVIPLLMVLIGKTAEKRSQNQWHELDRMSNYFLDVIQGLVTLKYFNQSKAEVKRIANVAEQFRQNTMAVLRVAFLSSMVLEFFAMASTAVVAILIGLRVYEGTIGFQEGFLILLLVPEFYAPLRKMGAAKHIKIEAAVAAMRIADYCRIAHDRVDKAFKPFVDEHVSVNFKDIQFGYDPTQPVFSEFNLTIEQGSHIALVGESGAGKSTVFNLLLGFIEAQKGDIIVNGQSLSGINMHEWRKTISWIPQSPTLLAGTIMENIKMGRYDATDSDVYALCERLGIHDFITNLPQGYATMLGERGKGLSGGEIQRIAIARALLRDAPLVLMDEPTASLDKDSEAVLNKAITMVTKDKTVLTTAHRLHTVQKADLILVMHHGKIVAKGTHDELLKNNESYKRLVTSEFTNFPQKEVPA